MHDLSEVRGNQLPARLQPLLRSNAITSSSPSCRALAGILALAFVFGELDPETLLRVRNPLHGTQGHFELAIAKSTDADGGDGPHPFDHSKIAFWNG